MSIKLTFRLLALRQSETSLARSRFIKKSHVQSIFIDFCVTHFFSRVDESFHFWGQPQPGFQLVKA